MFGHLPLIIKEVILSHGGQDRWDNLLKKIGMHEDFIECKIYDERLLDELINEAPNAINTRREAFMEMLGEAYLANMMAKGNSQMMRVLGSSFYEFIQNLDFLHTVSMAKYPKADIPLFKMEETVSSGNRVRLHYYSRREYFSRMVESLLRCVGRTIFRRDIGISIISETHDDDRYHVIYSVLLGENRESEVTPTMVAQTRKHGENQLFDKEVEREKGKLEQLKMEYGEDSLPVSRFRQQKAQSRSTSRMNVAYSTNPPRIPRELAIGAGDFCELFPYHILFDQSMGVKQAGVQMQFIVPELREENENITRHLDLIHPGKCDFSYHTIQKYICCPHVVKTRHNSLTSDTTQKGGVVYFRGQMIELYHKHLILYLCSPYVYNLDTVEHFGMHISDLPTHDVTKYLFQGCTSTESFKRRTGKGDWLEGFLGLSGQPIFGDECDDDAAEHKFTMVPRGIADQLKLGQKVEGKIYRNCSILFCDLVQFGQIVEKCTPTEVLSLINDLHERFDKLAAIHDVFKVDVIGDAYVIVSGIPNMVRNHAERIAKMALAMILVSKQTPSPYNFGGNIGARVLARIGLHCGDVIGGVIGRPVHRFTIIGEDVVLASRLESHGVPDRVHLSDTMNSELKPYKFEVEARGNVDIRGKGRMYTYLLKDNQVMSNDVLMGDKTPNSSNSYPLPMSPKNQGRVNQHNQNSNKKAHVPRHLRPKSSKSPGGF